jgi:ATP-dependent Clp protease protease subunit
MTLIPNVLEKTSDGERVFDLYSRLLRDRIVFCYGEVEDAMAENIVAQLLFLDSQDSSKPIQLWINSPGGSVTAGASIMDTMDYITAPVKTITLGLAASMGSEILANGTKGMRCALPRARILLHQASAAARGNWQDMERTFDETKAVNDLMLEAMAKNTGKTIEQIKNDTTRDLWFSAEQALAYGVIDKIIKPEEVK